MLLNTRGERAGQATVLVPETITEAHVPEGLAQDAAEDGADHGAGRRALRDTGRPEIDVIDVFVELLVLAEGVVGEDSSQIAEALGALKAAELTVVVVASDTVFTTTLHVHGSQIGTKVGLGFTEEVVGQLYKNKFLSLEPFSLLIRG